MEQKSKNGTLRLMEIAGPQKNLLILSAFLAILHALLSLVPYVLVYYIIKELVLQQVNISLLWEYLFWAGVAAFGSYTLLYASGMASHVAAFRILYVLRKAIAHKVGQLPMGYLNHQNSGALKKILADDVERIEGFIAHQIPDFVKGVAVPVITIGFLFTQDWRLAAISFVPLLILAIWMPLLFSSSKTKELLKKYHQSLEDMNSGIVEYVRAIPVMKIFGQSAEKFQKYGQTIQQFDHFIKAWMKKSTPPFAIFMSFMSNAMLPVLTLGIYLYFSQGLTLSTLFMFLILGAGYIKPLFALSNMGSQLSLINRGMQRIDDILQEKTQTNLTSTAQHPQEFSVQFQEVSFSYDGRTPVLDKVSFEVPAHSITALVGPSGAGKSTVGQLLARFWDVKQGTIAIGGIDIQQISLEQLMQHVSFVFQDNFMFQATIYDNILMGMDKSEAEVTEAAKSAQIHELIMTLPDGYNTRFGEAGVHLSGGEQQRIQLARAILKNAPILILDEATAFADPENEYKIQQAFSQLILDKTVLVIAHRLSTITDADQILVFDNGLLLGKGTHQELLANTPLYQRMWEAHTRSKNFALSN